MCSMLHKPKNVIFVKYTHWINLYWYDFLTPYLSFCFWEASSASAMWHQATNQRTIHLTVVWCHIVSPMQLNCCCWENLINCNECNQQKRVYVNIIARTLTTLNHTHTHLAPKTLTWLSFLGHTSFKKKRATHCSSSTSLLLRFMFNRSSCCISKNYRRAKANKKK